jgi:shikimate dehydrogenase
MSDRYAVFGNPVAHSKSPQIHKMFAQQTGQDMSYEAILAPLDGFENSVREFIAAGGRGVNVTVPFKEEAFGLATQRTMRASAAGAVNTLIFEGSEIVGENTDGEGLISDIEKNIGIQISGKRALLLGAGGAARGVMLRLLYEMPSSLVIANRTTERARQLTELFSAEAQGTLRSATFAQLAYDDAFDVVINATSAGLSGATLPLPDSVFSPDCLAYDMVYGRETPFMRQARDAGARVADGLGMLVEQAAEAFYVWRGVRPDTVRVLNFLRGK